MNTATLGSTITRRAQLGAVLLCCLLAPMAGAAATYANKNIAGAWIDPGGSPAHTKVTGNAAAPIAFRSSAGCNTTVPVTDDTLSDAIPLGFNFRFGDALLDGVRIMSNGRLQFVNTAPVNGTVFDNIACAFGTPDPYPLPAANIPYTMKVYAADLDPTNSDEQAGYPTNCVLSGCYVSYANLGTAPNQRFVVTWNNVPLWQSGGSSGSFQLQVIIDQNGTFTYQYGTNVSPIGSVAEIGWQANFAAGDFALKTFAGGLPQNVGVVFFDPAPTAIAASGGSPQSAAVNTAFASALSATVTNIIGDPVAGATVTFTLPASGASGTFPGNATSATAVTDGSGVAVSPTITANSLLGAYSASAAVAGVAAPATFGLANVAGPATKLAFLVQPGNTVSGAAIAPSVTVQVQDAAGNLVTGSTAPVTVAIGTNPASGTLSGTQTVNAVAGVATFGSLSIDKAGSGYTLTAGSTGLSSATSNAFNITAGTPAKLAFLGQPGNTASGAAISPAVIVQVQDAAGNLVTGSTALVTVAIGTNPASGTLSGTQTVNAVAGVATFGSLSIDKAGSGYTLTAGSTGLSSATSNAFNITAGAPAKLAFLVQPGNTVSGAAIAPSVTVQVQDAAGNLVTGSTALVTIAIGTNPASGTLSGTQTVNAVAGVATFGSLSIDKAGSGYTLTAGSTGLSSATSNAFNITAGAAASIAAGAGAPQSTPVGTAYPVAPQAIVKDAANNPVAGVSVTFTVPVSGASGTFPGGLTSVSVATDGSGVATAPTLTANATAGGFTLAATTVGVASPATFALLNSSGAAFTVVVTSTTAEWKFVEETPSGAGTFVTGPGVPPAGAGSVQLQAVTAAGGELYYTQQFAGLRLDSIKGLQYSTYVSTGTNGAALNMDFESDLGAPTATYLGRLVFVPNLLGSGAVVPGTWQTWDPLTQKGWYGTRAPLNALCSFSAPCTLAQVIAAYPNAGVLSQLAQGAVGFKIGSGGGPSTVSVDKFVIATGSTATTYDFEATLPPAASITIAGGSPQTAVIGNTFAAPLKVTVRDAANQLLSGASVAFTLPGSGASGNFPGSVTVANVVTDISGVATSPLVTANGTAGGYTATATAAGAGAPASFSLTNTPAATTTVLGSSANPSAYGQSITLTATVTPPGATGSVTFKDGAATLGSGTVSGGVATLSTAVLAQGSHGLTGVYGGDANYQSSTSAPLTQVVVVGPAASISASGGTPQTVPINGVFGAPLQATVRDAGGNAVAGATVIFTLPASGASGRFPGNLTSANALTDAGGVATAPAITANATVGSYAASATTAGVAAPATFSLTNAAGSGATLTLVSGGGQSTRVSTAFAAPLVVRLTDSGGNPVSGVTVTWSTVAVGARATLSSASSLTDAGGNASVNLTANGISGGFAIVAQSGAASISALFSNTIAVSSGGCAGNAATNNDLVEQYYQAVLRRPSDATGKAFWVSEADRLCALGVDPRQTFLVLADVFFNTPEYLAQGRDDTGFVTDLYVALLGRLPDAGGLSYWLGQLGSGMPRNNVMSSFLFLPEFGTTMQALFGSTPARAESYLVMNLYGGLFRRFPDSGGYSYWTGQFRLSQCAANPVLAVQQQVNTVTAQFLNSSEYLARNRSSGEYVQDLYYAMLQRGGDLVGYQYWTNQLINGVQTREQVRVQFVASPEMQAQSARIAAQGCLP